MTGSRGDGQAASVSKPRIIVLGCVTAVGAAIFAFLFFGLAVPPLDSSSLLNPPKSRPTNAVPAATVLPATPRLFLQDDFSSRANWTRADEAGGATFAEHGYLISPPPNGQFTHVYNSSLVDKSYRDLSVQITANAQSSSSGVGYGIFFWHSQDQNGHERFIYFGVTTDGAYTLRAAVPVTGTTAGAAKSQWVDLVPSTLSSLIHKNGQPNSLRVDVHPGRILAFLNGGLVIDQANQVVDAFRDREDFDGKVGLLAYSLTNGNPHVIFTAFSLYVDVNK